MALYRCATVHEGIADPYVGHQWRNVYTVEADSYASALATTDVLATYEQGFHTDKTRCFKVTAHLVTEPPRRAGAQMGVDRPGAYSPVGDAWPLWNVVRVSFSDVGLGRPEMKYYRVGLHDGMVQDDLTLLGTYETSIFGGLDGMIALTNYVGPSGEQHADYSLTHLVASRQVGWHRRRRPGFVRGYVAV